MAMTIELLKKYLDSEQLKYFVDPNRPACMLGMQGLCGRYQFILALENNGTFLQCRTLYYLQCPPDHPNLAEVLKVLGAINFKLRLVKFGWDPSDGEIMAYADAMIMDGQITQAQFNHMFRLFAMAVDMNFVRIGQAKDTGKDPGEIDPTTGGGLPPALRALLKKITGHGPSGPTSDPGNLDSI